MQVNQAEGMKNRRKYDDDDNNNNNNNSNDIRYIWEEWIISCFLPSREKEERQINAKEWSKEGVSGNCKSSTSNEHISSIRFDVLFLNAFNHVKETLDERIGKEQEDVNDNKRKVKKNAGNPSTDKASSSESGLDRSDIEDDKDQLSSSSSIHNIEKSNFFPSPIKKRPSKNQSKRHRESIDQDEDVESDIDRSKDIVPDSAESLNRYEKKNTGNESTRTRRNVLTAAHDISIDSFNTATMSPISKVSHEERETEVSDDDNNQNENAVKSEYRNTNNDNENEGNDSHDDPGSQFIDYSRTGLGLKDHKELRDDFVWNKSLSKSFNDSFSSHGSLTSPEYLRIGLLLWNMKLGLEKEKENLLKDSKLAMFVRDDVAQIILFQDIQTSSEKLIKESDGKYKITLNCDKEVLGLSKNVEKYAVDFTEPIIFSTKSTKGSLLSLQQSDPEPIPIQMQKIISLKDIKAITHDLFTNGTIKGFLLSFEERICLQMTVNLSQQGKDNERGNVEILVSLLKVIKSNFPQMPVIVCGSFGINLELFDTKKIESTLALATASPKYKHLSKYMVPDGFILNPLGEELKRIGMGVFVTKSSLSFLTRPTALKREGQSLSPLIYTLSMHPMISASSSPASSLTLS